MTQQPEPVLLALAFVFFWITTLELSINSAIIYVIRSIVVVGYTMVTMADEKEFVSLAEMTAQLMVCSHWMSLVTVFLFPDPRFRRRKCRV